MTLRFRIFHYPPISVKERVHRTCQCFRWTKCIRLQLTNAKLMRCVLHAWLVQMATQTMQLPVQLRPVNKNIWRNFMNKSIQIPTEKSHIFMQIVPAASKKKKKSECQPHQQRIWNVYTSSVRPVLGNVCEWMMITRNHYQKVRPIRQQPF